MVDPDIKDIVQKLRILLLDIQQLSLASETAPEYYKRKIVITLKDIQRDLERNGKLRKIIERVVEKIQHDNYEEARNELEKIIGEVLVGGSR